MTIALWTLAVSHNSGRLLAAPNNLELDLDKDLEMSCVRKMQKTDVLNVVTLLAVAITLTRGDAQDAFPGLAF